MRTSSKLRLFSFPIALSALSALFLLSSCGSSSTDLPDPSIHEASRIACVDKINAYRATQNLPALKRWTESEACADGQAKSDSETGRAHGAFGDCKEWAQNECPGWGSVQSTIDGCLQSMWDERLTPSGEQGHYKSMSSTRYTQVACGFYETPKGKVWALQNFK
jgi:hypothetical protein